MNKHSVTKRLKKRNLSLAIAESCTGGLVSNLLTDIPGSSQYFKLGIVAYSNRLKHEILKVPQSLLDSKGAVSKEVALLMAKNIRKIASTNIGIGITGIAGPSGGTKLKPVGLVYIAVATKNKSLVRKFNFKRTRSQIRYKAALKALSLINNIV
jgi:nicotinamide-nucleotide amidase